MTPIITSESIIGQVLTGLTNTTGSLALTLVLIIIALVLICVLAGLPVETSVIVVFPLAIASWAYTGEAGTIGGVMAIYLALLFAKNLPFK